MARAKLFPPAKLGYAITFAPEMRRLDFTVINPGSPGPSPTPYKIPLIA
jgi:hypothetical protein